jgi:hypothetical protein
VAAFLERTPPSQLFKSWQGPAQFQRRELCSMATAARSIVFHQVAWPLEATPLTSRQKIDGRRLSALLHNPQHFMAIFGSAVQ